MEFIVTNGKYIIEKGIIKHIDKKDKLLKAIFIDKINWIYLYGDDSKFSLIVNKVQLHMNHEIVDLIAEDYNQANEILDAILEEKRKMIN